MDELITPGRAKEIRRTATHQAGMILVTALRAGWDPEHYFPDEAERDLVLEEVERIAGELLARALVGTRRPCSVCGFPYLVRKGGVIGHHVGTDAAGFSTGRWCDGVGEPPRT
jgi:hypothetical protein